MSGQNIETAYLYCPRCGAKSKASPAVPFRCAECNFANFFGPVGAVGAIVTDGEGKVLFVRRAKNPGKGMWGLPGGFIDRGESGEQALCREVLEETGLTVTQCNYLLSAPNNYNYQGLVAPVIDLFYTCEVEPGPIELVDGELDHYEWARPSEDYLSHMAFESNRKALEYWASQQSAS